MTAIELRRPRTAEPTEPGPYFARPKCYATILIVEVDSELRVYHFGVSGSSKVWEYDWFGPVPTCIEGYIAMITDEQNREVARLFRDLADQSEKGLLVLNTYSQDTLRPAVFGDSIKLTFSRFVPAAPVETDADLRARIIAEIRNTVPPVWLRFEAWEDIHTVTGARLDDLALQYRMKRLGT